MGYLRQLALIIILGVIAGCNPTSEESGGLNRIVYGLTLEVSGIDPHINQNAELGIVLRQVYDTLVYRDPETKTFVPGLAQSWTISEDGLVYTFSLRDDVVFHDGTPFNAQAVATNLDRIRNPEIGSQRAVFLLGPLTEYQIVDDYTIQLILSEPYSPLLDALSQVYLGIASPKALAEYSTIRYQYHQVGTGPYTFVEYLPGDHITIRRNPIYNWGPSFYRQDNEYPIEEIEFRFYRDPATRLLALESGEAQIMGEILPTDARNIIGREDIQLLPVEIPGQPLQFYMNTRLFPTDSVVFRQALLYATNRTTIVDAVFQGFSPIAWGPISRKTDYYNPSLRNLYAYDVTRAQNLLASLGYTDSDGDGWLDIGGVTIEVKIIVPPWGQVPDVAQLIQDQWRLVGIRAILEPVPGFSALRERVINGDYHLVAFDAFGVDPSILNPRFLSSGADNWTGFSSAQLDSLLLEAVLQNDPNQRLTLYAQAQAIIMNEALILPIRDYVNLNAHTSAIQNLSFEPIGWFPLLYNASYQPQGR